LFLIVKEKSLQTAQGTHKCGFNGYLDYLTQYSGEKYADFMSETEVTLRE